MLVLTRKLGERIIVGEGVNTIVIELCDAIDGKARIGITANPSIPVNREEIHKRTENGETWRKHVDVHQRKIEGVPVTNGIKRRREITDTNKRS